MKTAISYLRFSSKKQSANDSYRRQIEATEKFCKDKNLVLSRRLEDLGISAWTGKNLSDESALGGFLKLVEAGKIPKGTILICENLDRLSRAKILDALSLFTSILKNGIEIVTSMDGKWYSEKSVSENPADLMISIIYLTRGNNESETKSNRVLEAAKRRGVKLGNPQYEAAITKAVEVRQKIAADRNAGLRKTVAETMKKTGLTKLAEIAEALNLRGIKTNRGCQFTPTHIHRLLKTA